MLSRFPVAFRPPAFASRVILSPLGNWAFLTVGLPAHDTVAGPQRGSHVPHARDTTGVGALLYPGDGGAHPADMRSPAGACRFPAASPCTPALASHQRGSRITRHQREVHAIHPSGLPLACDPRMEQGSLGFPPSFAPRRYQRRTSGWGQAIEHRPGTTQPTSAGPPICESTRYVRPRVARPTKLMWNGLVNRAVRGFASSIWGASNRGRLLCRFSVLSSRGFAVGGAVAAATPLSPVVVVGVGGGLDHAPGRGWWADRQTDVRGSGPQFGYSQKGALD